MSKGLRIPLQFVNQTEREIVVFFRRDHLNALGVLHPSPIGSQTIRLGPGRLLKTWLRPGCLAQLHLQSRTGVGVTMWGPGLPGSLVLVLRPSSTCEESAQYADVSTTATTGLFCSRRGIVAQGSVVIAAEKLRVGHALIFDAVSVETAAYQDLVVYSGPDGGASALGF